MSYSWGVSFVRISVCIENILLNNAVVRFVAVQIKTVREMLCEGAVNPNVLREKVKTVKTEQSDAGSNFIAHTLHRF